MRDDQGDDGVHGTQAEWSVALAYSNPSLQTSSIGRRTRTPRRKSFLHLTGRW
jgi:hypothetical protein